MTDEITEKYIQELLSTGTGTEGSLLIPKKIHAVLIKAVDKALIPRSEAMMYIGPAMIPGSSYDLNLEAEDAMDVRLIGEGGEIILDSDEYSSTNIKPKKYGVSVRITGEMKEDSQFPLLSLNVSKAGKRFVENETRLILTALQGCTNAVAGGAAITIPDFTRGMQYLEDADYESTSALVGTEVVNDMRNIDTFVEANRMGNREILATGFLGTVLGMNFFRFSTRAAPSTTYSKYAYVYDRAEAYAIAEKRTITVEGFKLPIFDMEGAALTQRLAVALVRDNAVCRISTS